MTGPPSRRSGPRRGLPRGTRADPGCDGIRGGFGVGKYQRWSHMHNQVRCSGEETMRRMTEVRDGFMTSDDEITQVAERGESV